MAQGHTQGRTEVIDTMKTLITVDKRIMAEAKYYGHAANELSLGIEEAQANARRLAACWNACLGLSTEELEADIVADFERALHHWDGMAPSVEKHMGSDPNIGRCARSAIQRTSTVLARIP